MNVKLFKTVSIRFHVSNGISLLHLVYCLVDPYNFR